MLFAIPLLILPFALYNIAMLGLFGDGGVAVLDSEVMAVNMLSGTTWTMAFGDLLILIAVFLGFFELLGSTSASTIAIVSHGLQMIVFLVALLLLLLLATRLVLLALPLPLRVKAAHDAPPRGTRVTAQGDGSVGVGDNGSRRL